MRTEEQKQKAAEYQKKYRQANLAKQQEAIRKWQLENPDYNKKWADENRDKVNSYAKKSREANPERVAEIRKRHYKKNKEAIIADAKKWAKDNPERKILNAARRSATANSIPFDLEIEDIVIPETCPVFGIPLFFSDGPRTWNTPSIDKIVPELGYVKGNIRIVSWRANWLKSNATHEELEALSQYTSQ